MIGYILASLETLWRLLGQYIQSPLFVVMHVVVFYTIVKSFGKLKRETLALKKWSPENPGQGKVGGDKADTVGVLDQFVNECNFLGPQGMIVPMTDFSDRIDSHIEGLVSELSERINMLLIIGIAGTLFGVFSFVADPTFSSSSDGMDTVQKVSELLTTSMAKAFPVGFVGLLGMLVCQYIASNQDDLFRKAATEATGRAIRHRAEKIVSQPDVLKKLIGQFLTYASKTAEQQCERNRDVALRIETALKPLGNLQNTLTELVNPVVNQLAERLDKALELVQAQTTQTKQVGEHLADSLSGMDKSVASLVEVAGSLQTILSDVPMLVHETAPALKEVTKASKANLKTAEALTQRVADLSEEMLGLPAKLKEQFVTIHQAVADLHASLQESELELLQQRGTKILEQWERLSNDLQRQVAESAGEAGRRYMEEVERQLGVIKDGISGAANSLGTASTRWQDTANNIEGILSEPKRVTEAWRTQVIEQLGAIKEFCRQTPQIIQGLSSAASAQSDAAGKIAEAGVAQREANALMGEVAAANREAVEKAGRMLEEQRSVAGKAEELLRVVQGLPTGTDQELVRRLDEMRTKTHGVEMAVLDLKKQLEGSKEHFLGRLVFRG